MTLKLKNWTIKKYNFEMNIEYELLNRKGQKLMMICSKIDKKLMIYLAIL